MRFHEVSNAISLPLDARFSSNQRVMNNAVNIEEKIPITKIIAKPYAGPEPANVKINPANKVVMLESIMALNACLKPKSMAVRIPLPLANSSLILS